MLHTRLHFFTSLLSIFLVLILFATACQSKYGDASDKRIADEEQAEQFLSKAREQLKSGHFDKAKQTIKTMRDSCPLALSCRKQGILLMDSIELFAATADTAMEDRDMRVKFYLKKLQHDRAELFSESADK